MDEVFKELGKFLYNLSLLIAGALIFQPLAKGKISMQLITFSIVSIVVFILFGSVFIYAGEKLKSKEG